MSLVNLVILFCLGGGINNFAFFPFREDWYWQYVRVELGVHLSRPEGPGRFCQTCWVSACCAHRRDISMAVPLCRVAYQTDVDCWLSWQQQSMGCPTFWYLSSHHPYRMCPFSHDLTSWCMVCDFCKNPVLCLVALRIFYVVMLQHRQEDFTENWDAFHDHR